MIVACPRCSKLLRIIGDRDPQRSCSCSSNWLTDDERLNGLFAIRARLHEAHEIMEAVLHNFLEQTATETRDEARLALQAVEDTKVFLTKIADDASPDIGLPVIFKSFRPAPWHSSSATDTAVASWKATD